MKLRPYVMQSRSFAWYFRCTDDILWHIAINEDGCENVPIMAFTNSKFCARLRAWETGKVLCIKKVFCFDGCNKDTTYCMLKKIDDHQCISKDLTTEKWDE